MLTLHAKKDIARILENASKSVNPKFLEALATRNITDITHLFENEITTALNDPQMQYDLSCGFKILVSARVYSEIMYSMFHSTFEALESKYPSLEDDDGRSDLLETLKLMPLKLQKVFLSSDNEKFLSDFAIVLQAKYPEKFVENPNAKEWSEDHYEFTYADGTKEILVASLYSDIQY